MRIVYSHWTRPGSMTADKRITLALSVLLARKHYGQIEMVTDTAGADLFQRMGLVFDKVSFDLNGFVVPEGAWAAGKIHAYAIQQEPFIHIDHDVFLFQPFPEWLTSADVVAQSDEGRWRYNESLTKVLPSHRDIIRLPDERWHAYNTGIFGGNEVEFIQAYAKRSLELIREHTNFHWWTMPVYEQAFLSRFADDHGKEVTLLLKDEDEAEDLGYCHLMECKIRPECMAKVHRKLQDLDIQLYRRAVLAGD